MESAGTGTDGENMGICAEGALFHDLRGKLDDFGIAGMVWKRTGMVSKGHGEFGSHFLF